MSDRSIGLANTGVRHAQPLESYFSPFAHYSRVEWRSAWGVDAWHLRAEFDSAVG
nr:hypothetical protein [Phormidesmis priestleyi]